MMKPAFLARFAPASRSASARVLLLRFARFSPRVLLALLAALAPLAQFAPPAYAQKPIPVANVSRSEPVSFEREVLPIFRQKCLACHSASEENGGLVLETPAAILSGGDSGPAAAAGNGAASLLLKVAAHQQEPVMPPPDNDVAARPLTSEELGLLKLWIDQGAKGTGLSGILSPQRWRPLPPGTHPIYTVATTSDGQFVACGRANQIFIYHIATGRLVTRLTDPDLQDGTSDGLPGTAHRDVVQSLAFNQQGDRLASGGFRTAKIWRYPRDVQRLRLAAGEDTVTAVAVGPAGRWIATGSADHSIRLFDAASGEVLQTLAGHTGAVTSLRFSRDGQRLYSGSLDHSIRVWQLSDGALVGRIVTPDPVRALTTVYESLPEPTSEPDAAAAGAPAAGAADSPSNAPAEVESPSDQASPAGESEKEKVPPAREMLVSAGDELIRRWDVPRSLPRALAAGPATAPPRANPPLLALSADRTLIALADETGKIEVRDTATGELLKSWQAHESAIHDLAFAPRPVAASETAGARSAEAETQPEADAAAESPSLDRVASAGEDGTVRIWNAVSGEPLGVLRGSLTPVRSLAFSHDATQLTAGTEDGQVTCWRLSEVPVAATPSAAGEEPPRDSTAIEPSAAAGVAVLSGDGKLLATTGAVGDRPAILVRVLATGNLAATLLGHDGPVTSLAFSADATRVVSGSADHSVRVWDLRDAKFPEQARFNGHAGPVTAVAFNADATRVLSGAADHSVRLWTVANVEEVVECAGHTGRIVGVAFAAGQQPVSASADKTIRFWDAAGKAQRTITAVAPLSGFAASPDGARLAAAATDNSVVLHQATDGKLLHTLTGLPAAGREVRFSADGTRVMAAETTGAAVWRVEDGRLLERVESELPLTTAAYGPTRETLWFGREDGSLRQRTLRFLQSLGPFGDAVTDLAYRADDQVIFGGSLDGTLRALNLQNGQPVFQANHGAPVHALALHADGQRLASAGEDQQIKLWNAANGAALAPNTYGGFAGPVQALAFAADGSQLIGAGGGETPQLLAFEVAGGQLLQVLDAPEQPARSLAVSGKEDRSLLAGQAGPGAVQYELPGLQWVAGHTAPVTSLATVGELQVVSGSEDGTLRHWNLAAASPQVRVLNHGGPVTSVAVSPDGERFASTSSNHTARLWNAANGQQIGQMRGDLRAQALVAKLTRRQQDWTAKVATAKTALEAAQKVVPTRTTAETQAATALAAAEKDVAAKTTTVTQAAAAKGKAEQQAIQMAAAAQLAAQKMKQAEQLALTANAKAKLLSDKATQARLLAQADPDNQQLSTAAETAAAAATAAAEEAKAADAAKAAPTQAAQAAAKVAETAALEAVKMAKPFVDATTALTTSQDALGAARQAHEIAARELATAQAAVPEAQEFLTKAEATLKAAQDELAAAVEAEKQAQQPLRCVRFSPDGRLLATGGDLGVVHTWDAESGKPIASYEGHAGAVHAVAFLSAGELVSGAADPQAAVWNLNPSWELERVIGSIDDPTTLVDRVVAVDFSPDGRLLATGGGVPSRNGEVKLWEVADGSLVHSLPNAHTDGVNDVAFSPDGSLLASAAADKFVKAWDVETGRQALQFEGHTDHVLGVTWRSNGKMLVSAGADATIRVWNAETGDRIRSIAGYNKQVTSVRFVGQTQFFVSSAGDPLVRMHNSDNGGVQRNFAGAEDYMYGVDATPDGTVVVAVGHDGVLRIWNGTNAQVMHTIGAPVPEDLQAPSPLATQ